MLEALNQAALLCKSLFRNGYDAHVINAPLQERLLAQDGKPAVDIACEADYPVIAKVFPDAQPAPETGPRLSATLEQDGVLFRFYPLSCEDAEHPELSLMKITPTMVDRFTPEDRRNLRLTGFGSPKPTNNVYDGFQDLSCGAIKLVGIPDDTLRHNYLLAIRALRFAANFDLPLGHNTWLAIIRSASRVLDYVPASDIMDEWRKVEAESMHTFVKYLFDCHILHGLIPEVAALACIKQRKNKKSEEFQDLFTHTLECIRHYPEGEFHYDWLGTYYQHHRVGALVTRKILRRLHFLSEDIDLICHLVRYHMRFYCMMTDRGIRRFKSLLEYPRLIEMSRADLAAREDALTTYKHNMKYLHRAETPEQMLEPLLNGNEIMQITKLKPGPQVGLLRDALLQAQIAGDVTDADSARAFVQDYARRSL